MMAWMDDEALMEELTRAARQGEVPDHRRQAAYGAFAWRSVDEELLALTHDSALQATAAVRGDEDARTLSFEGGDLTLELEVDDGTVAGQLLASVGEVTLEQPDGERRAARTDASGFFTLSSVSGPVRFAVEVDGVLRRTPWVNL